MAKGERRSLYRTAGREVTCATEMAPKGEGEEEVEVVGGETEEHEVIRATWSTGTMLMVLLMSGTSPNWIDPLTSRQMKSSVLVTADSESPTTYPGRTIHPAKPRLPASMINFSATHLVWP